MALKSKNLLAHLPNELQITGSELHDDFLEVFVKYPNPPIRVCPYCGSKHNVVKDHSTQSAFHLPQGSRGTILTFRKTRYLCKSCGRSFTHQPYWFYAPLRMTTDLYLTVVKDLRSSRPICEIADKNKISEDTLWSLIDTLDLGKPKHLPETICIDEFNGSTGTWNPSRKCWQREKFHCNIADGDRGVIIDILPQIGHAYLKEYFMQYSLDERRRVRFLCCDMHGGFIALSKSVFPDVKVCLDMFHVIQRLEKVVDRVRIDLQRKYLSNGDRETYELLKRSPRLLKTKLSNFDKRWRNAALANARLDQLLSLSIDLKEAYEALQNFHIILEQPGLDIKKMFLSEWIREYETSEVKDLRTAVGSIRYHRSYIHNSWKYGKSNGPAEGLNSRVKLVRKNAYGMHSFQHFRKRVLLACGDFELDEMKLFGLDQQVDSDDSIHWFESNFH